MSGVLAILAEIWLVLWISAEFFSGIDRPRAAVCLLGISIGLFLIYIAHKVAKSKMPVRYKRAGWPVFWLLTTGVGVACLIATDSISEKERLHNKPQVIPPIVQLHDGKYGRISRVLISNPSDSWIYNLTILIQVKSNAVPLGSVASWLAEGKSKDVFDESKTASSNPHPGFPAAPNFPMMDAFGLEFFNNGAAGRLLILSALAPKEERVPWIKGPPQNNLNNLIRHGF